MTLIDEVTLKPSGPNGGTFSLPLTACFIVNCLIGTGFLAIPWAFEQAGVLLSSICLILTALLSTLTTDYTLTTLARAEVFTSYLESHPSVCPTPLLGTPLTSLRVSSNKLKIANDDTAANINTYTNTSRKQLMVLDDTLVEEESRVLINAKTQLEARYGSLQQSSQKQTLLTANINVDPVDDEMREEIVSNLKHVKWCRNSGRRMSFVGDRALEYPDLFSLFLNKGMSRFYMANLSLCLFILLWAYTSVFATALGTALPFYGEFSRDYDFYVALFAIIMIPVSISDFEEQAAFQVCVSIARVLVFVLLIGTSVVNLYCDGNIEVGNDTMCLFSENNGPVGAPLIRIEGFPQMLPSVLTACALQQAVPGFSRLVHAKAHISVVFHSVMAACVLSYIALGVLVAWNFGEDVAQSANVIWNTYGLASWKYGIVRSYITLFPALDMISVFPLNAVVLGDNINSLIGVSSTQVMNKRNNLTVLCRLVACIPPLIGAYFIRELGFILEMIAFPSLLVGFFFPPLLYIASSKKLEKYSLPTDTCYQKLGSSNTMAYMVLIIGVLLCGVLLWCYIAQ